MLNDTEFRKHNVNAHWSETCDPARPSRFGDISDAGRDLLCDEDISEFGIYVALARMRADGWLQSTKDEDTGGARGSPHRRYAINAAGRRVLQLADEIEAARAHGVRV